ncbi:MAG: hypothetical protein EKK40_12415 [Bradyrhizobiaceae bacterium]|nr:MAG: hypothetical protein EKK40_12415 [Bradyrhizobiaceae bacterium]
MTDADPSRFVIYLCHGGKKFFDQTIFSALTLLDLLLKQGRRDYRIVIYTDRPDAFPRHDLIRAIGLTPEEIVAYKGPLDYVHRTKLKVLQRACADIGPALHIYVDCDTRWLKLPDAAFDALKDPLRDAPAAYFYENEGEIRRDFYPHYFRALQKSGDLLRSFGLRPGPPWSIWNSGVVAFSENEIRAGIMNDIVALNDELVFFFTPRNMVEQLALSLVAENRCQMHSFGEFLVHYWRQTLALPIVLERFFRSLGSNMPVEQMAQACAAFAIDEKDLQRIQNEVAPRGIRKVAGKLRNSIRKRRIDLRAWRLWHSRSAHS